MKNYISAVSVFFMLGLGTILPTTSALAQSAGVNSTSGDLPVGASGYTFMTLGGNPKTDLGIINFGASTSNPTAWIDTNSGNSSFGGSLSVGTTTNPLAIFNVHAGPNENFLITKSFLLGIDGVTVDVVNDANTTPVGLSFWAAKYDFGNGNVGISTTTPASTLDVNGEIRVGNTGVSCSSANEGTLQYNKTNHVMNYCNGSAWTSLSSPGPLIPTETVTSPNDSSATTMTSSQPHVLCMLAHAAVWNSGHLYDVDLGTVSRNSNGTWTASGVGYGNTGSGNGNNMSLICYDFQ